MEEFGVAGVVGVIVYLAVLGLMITSMWKIFSKAGQPGWASIIPVYNIVVLLEIAGKPGWWFFLMLIPGVNIFISIILWHSISLSFGKGVGFTVGIFFLGIVFLPILAFSDAEYFD